MTEILEHWHTAASSPIMRENATIWHFIPPYAPHMGGLHEAAVKSAKHHLRRVIGNQQLTFEELATLLTHIEACLNSRPITSLTDNAGDAIALTPSHFLIGESIISPLMRDHINTPNNRLSHFQLLQKFAQEFWARWREEHVKSLINRTKWHQGHQNIKPGDLVLLLNEFTSPAQWPLAKVIHVYPDEEGRVRMADVLYQEKIALRPIHKMCRLPMETELPEGPEGDHVQN